MTGSDWPSSAHRGVRSDTPDTDLSFEEYDCCFPLSCVGLIILGILCIVANIIAILFYDPYGILCHGFICGFVFVVTGIVGLISGTRKSARWRALLAVLCIVSAAFTIALLIIGIYATIQLAKYASKCKRRDKVGNNCTNITIAWDIVPKICREGCYCSSLINYTPPEEPLICEQQPIVMLVMEIVLLVLGIMALLWAMWRIFAYFATERHLLIVQATGETVRPATSQPPGTYQPPPGHPQAPQTYPPQSQTHPAQAPYQQQPPQRPPPQQTASSPYNPNTTPGAPQQPTYPATHPQSPAQQPYPQPQQPYYPQPPAQQPNYPQPPPQQPYYPQPPPQQAQYGTQPPMQPPPGSQSSPDKDAQKSGCSPFSQKLKNLFKRNDKPTGAQNAPSAEEQVGALPAQGNLQNPYAPAQQSQSMPVTGSNTDRGNVTQPPQAPVDPRGTESKNSRLYAIPPYVKTSQSR